MRACLITLLVLIWPPSARAGLYVDSPVEPGAAPTIAPERFMPSVLGLRGAAAVHKEALDRFSPRAVFLRQVAELEQRRKDGLLNPSDRANLGGLLVRLGRAGEAVNVLRGGLASGHFLIYANLATAHFLEGDFRQAIRVQELLLKSWPVVWHGPRGVHLAWYRECERAFLQLMKLREQESARRPTGPAELDALFPKVRFVGPSGRYQPGVIAPRYADELPSAAINTVLQLCIWLPGDLRLYWLLGEVLNANGHVEYAELIFKSLLARPKDDPSFDDNRFKDLKAHHVILERALPVMKGLRSGDLAIPLFCVGQAIPLPPLATGVAGPLTSATAAWASYWALPELQQQWQQPNLPPPPSRDQGLGRLVDEKAAADMPNWRHIGASFGFGAAATALIGLQWREWQRRRARRRAESPGPVVRQVAARDERITGPS